MMMNQILTLTNLSHPLLVLITVDSAMLTCGIGHPIPPNTARRSGLALRGPDPSLTVGWQQYSPAVKSATAASLASAAKGPFQLRPRNRFFLLV